MKINFDGIENVACQIINNLRIYYSKCFDDRQTDIHLSFCVIEDKRYLLAINIDEDSGTVLSPKTNNRKPSKRSNDTKGSVKGVAVQNRKNSMHSVQEHLCEKIRNKKIENIKSNENSISGSSASSHDIKRGELKLHTSLSFCYTH